MELIEAGKSVGIKVTAVGGSRVAIGRSPENGVVIDNDTVSRRHALMERVGQSWRIRDLGSRNGTYVNGVRVTGSAVVRPGDRITLGEAALRIAEGPSESHQNLATILPARRKLDEYGLTPREREVLRQVAEGHTDEQIAGNMVLSIKTVRSHLDRIRDKTGARRRPELTRFALLHQLVDPEDLV